MGQTDPPAYLLTLLTLNWTARLSAPAPAEFPVHPFERYGLQLVEDLVVAPAPPPAYLERASFRAMRVFDWALLTGFAVLEFAYLAALAHAARWALRWLIGS